VIESLQFLLPSILLLALAMALALGFPPLPHSHVPEDKPERARVVYFHPLPKLNGANLQITTVEVNYGPGESSLPHRHPCPVVGYVLQGTLRMQVQGEPTETYTAGQSFYEAPNGIHLVSANASSSAPAKFLAYFVCDSEVPLSAPVPESKHEGVK
jgi:quercetin dioxygenase-like cupin family protein